MKQLTFDFGAALIREERMRKWCHAHRTFDNAEDYRRAVTRLVNAAVRAARKDEYDRVWAEVISQERLAERIRARGKQRKGGRA